MKRRSLFTGALAAVSVGVGAGLFLARDALRIDERFARWPACDGERDVRGRIAADYRDARVVVSDRWVLAESEAELLDQIARDGVASAVRTVCANT